MTVQPTQVALADAMATERQERFRVLLERYRGIVLKVAKTYAGNADDRADLAQEIAAQLWSAFPRYDDSRPFATWMYRVALNVGISFLRGRSADAREVALDAEYEAIAAPPGISLEGAERLHRLERAIARLDGMSRALLLLYLEERSYGEIS